MTMIAMTVDPWRNDEIKLRAAKMVLNQCGSSDNSISTAKRLNDKATTKMKTLE